LTSSSVLLYAEQASTALCSYKTQTINTLYSRNVAPFFLKRLGQKSAYFNNFWQAIQHPRKIVDQTVVKHHIEKSKKNRFQQYST